MKFVFFQDILINNAGVMYIGMTEAFSIGNAKDQMEINYFGAMKTIQAGLPAMGTAKSELIINTSSVVGQISSPLFATYSVTKHALEGYTQGLHMKCHPFGIDVCIVELGPFRSGLLGGGKAPDHSDVLASYGELANIPSSMIEYFGNFLESEEAPNPQLVVDACLALAEIPVGKRLTPIVVGITWGVDEINAAKQPIQDRVLREIQLEGVLGGASV